MATVPTPVPRDHRRRRLVIALATIAAAGGAAVVLGGHHGSTGSTAPGTVRGSGVAAVQTRTLPRFTAVDLAGSNVVHVAVGGRQSVAVHADDNLLGHVTTAVRSGTLVVDETGSFSTRSPMYVEVTVPALAAVSLGGSGLLTVDGVGSRRLAVRVGGSGRVVAAGSVGRLDARLSGSGDVELQALSARDATAVVPGTGLLRVLATRSLHATVTGTGAVLYGGDPARVVTAVTGTGAIVPA
jgi:hypothetical protein